METNLTPFVIDNLSPLEIDYWVGMIHDSRRITIIPNEGCVAGDGNQYYSPSTDWSIAGPIIDSNDIELIGSIGKLKTATIYCGGGVWIDACGKTNLLAAMRCFLKYKIYVERLNENYCSERKHS